MPTIPREIITLILSRLPVKSLAQFKCVCKSWLTLITSPFFSDLHFRNYVSNNSNRLLIFGPSAFIPPHARVSHPIPEFNLYTLYIDSLLSPPSALPLPLGYANSRSFKIVGSCNGLLCIVNTDFEVILLNPSTRQYKLLNLIPDVSQLAERVFRNFGFGYDAVNDDYKVVLVLEYVVLEELRRRTLVYSTVTDSWRLVSDDYCIASIESDKSGVLVGTHLLHWVTWCADNNEDGIDSFDLCNEKWTEGLWDKLIESKSGPWRCCKRTCYQSMRSEGEFLMDIGVLDGYLCLLTGSNHDQGVSTIWVWKKYNVADSWVKLDISDLITTNVRNVSPIAWCKYEKEILMKNKFRSEFFWYNPNEKIARNAGIQGELMYRKAVVCSDSLVSIPGGLQIESESHNGEGDAYSKHIGRQ